MSSIVVRNKESLEKAIKAIGEGLINRAKDISNDIDKVNSIEIKALITPTEIVNFDITKNYTAWLSVENKEDNKSKLFCTRCGGRGIITDNFENGASRVCEKCNGAGVVF